MFLNAETEPFEPPGPADFDYPAIPGTGSGTFEFLGQAQMAGITKPMVQIVIAGILVFVFFYYASRKRAMVPGRLQYVGEEAYGFVRNSMGRDIIGSQDFQKFVPYLFALFFFLLFNNLMGSIPFIQFPTFSRSGMVYSLALMSWLIYNAVGIKKHGFAGYFKLQSVPAGVGGPILLLLIPLEFMSNIQVRPVTLALRLFANMFAGHTMMAVLAMFGMLTWMGTENLLVTGAISIISIIASIAITFLELFVAFLQAFIFMFLTTVFIGQMTHHHEHDDHHEDAHGAGEPAIAH
jgi:F-type H+-transporting ATPase subunit a